MRISNAILALVPFLALTLTAPTAAAQDKDTPKTDTQDPKPKDTGVAIGAAAPDFTLKDVDGKTVKLSDYKGKLVVLEWFNPGCPFVVQAHGKDGALCTEMAAKMPADVVWLKINSGATGKEGAGVDASKKGRDEWKIKCPVLVDESGEVGRMYGAKSTPHMFVIDTKGMLAYRGALDNAPMGKVEGDKKINYVEAAIADLKAGKPVATKETKSYGCSVKYAAKP